MIEQSLLRHLMLSYQMLLDVIDECPDDLWIDRKEDDSVWKRVLHVLEGIDYWFDDFSEYQFPVLFKDYSAEMDLDNKTSLTKQQIREYTDLIEKKIVGFFQMMAEKAIANESKKHPKVTYIDIVLSQIRHIQINIGYYNEKMNAKGRKSVEWIGYNEQ
jgi:hypothetical protein